MPVLTVRHVTTYRYRQPVAFGEHRMMFRPREGHDQRILDVQLNIEPRPVSIRWLHDVFGNSVTLARFTGRAKELRFESIVRLDHRPLHALDFQIEDHAESYPSPTASRTCPTSAARSSASTRTRSATSSAGRASSCARMGQQARSSCSAT